MNDRTLPRLGAWFWIITLVATGVQALGGDGLPARPSPTVASSDGMEPVGGRWYLRRGESPTYYYKDGDLYVDLFSYHMQDSNKDGIANLKIRHDGRFLRVDSQGYPDHPTAIFPNSRNPNRIEVQDFHFAFPLEPKRASRITRVPGGEIGMAINGVVFFNPFEAGGMNALAGYSEIWLDACCGHPQQEGVYHYHKYPSCVKTPFADEGRGHSPILGFAFDGFPLHGPYEEAGKMARDLTGDRALDVCNGHEDPSRGYHYHVTPGRFPYLIGGYAGVPEPSNNRHLARMPSGAIEDNAEGVSRVDAGVRSVTPGTVKRGESHTIRIMMDPQTARGGLPPGKPSWVQFGPYEASKIERQGDVILAEVAVPKDASLGVTVDLHVEFGAAGGRGRVMVFKKNDVLRVVD
ncbi:YHYH protein [Paludisphaera rhizosphaerae]|uniref:YHYH protein n=1 Tax=Paludisphaera rhizosphaerae TaxID=2711216 RepID=UPI00198201D1|nr:YHYH protein [Paludisphaera rhizosphaerae]